MPINRQLASQQDVYIAVRQLDDEISTLRATIANLQAKLDKLKGGANGTTNGSGGTPSTPVHFGGDLSGNQTSQTVVGIQGIPVDTASPSANQVLSYTGSMWSPASPTGGGPPVNFAGDLAGSKSSQTVIGIQNVPVNPTAPTPGQYLGYNGTNWIPANLPAPTPPAISSIGGDLGGTSTSQTVIGIQGKPVSPAAPATNQVLEWNGSTWVPTNLPTIPAAQVNSDWNASSGVAMILNKPVIPSSITFAGDLTGTATSQTVVGLQGKPVATTIPGTNNLLAYSGTQWTPVSSINVLSATTSSLSVTGNSQFAKAMTISSDTVPNTFNNSTTFGSNVALTWQGTGGQPYFKTIVDGSNYWTLQGSNSGGASWNNCFRTDYAGNCTVFGGLTTSNPFKINSPDASRNLTITVANGADPSITSSTAILNISGTTPRMLAGSSIQFWNPANNGYGSIYSDANYLWVNPPSGQSVVLGQQVWNGGVNANTYSLGNLSGLALTSGRLSTTGNSTDFVMFNTGSTKYLQFIPADGSQGANPYIFSSTGIIVTNSGINLPYATFTTPASINFGSNWQTWTPTLTANAGTLTPTAWYYNYYIRVGPIVFFSIRFAFNASAAFGYFYVTMPITGFTPSNNYMGVGSCMCESGPLSLENLLMRWELSDHVVIQRAGGAQFALGNSYLICMNGFYRIA